MNRFSKRYVFFKTNTFLSYRRVCFQLVAFVRQHLVIYYFFVWMWYKAIWMGHPMILELTRVGWLVEWFFPILYQFIYRGHCFILDFSSSSSLSLSQSVSPVLPRGYIYPIVFDIWYAIKFFVVLLWVLVCVSMYLCMSVCIVDMLLSLFVIFLL